MNLGKNKTTPEESAADDYVVGVENIGEYGHYIVVNISSPNTPGLEKLTGTQTSQWFASSRRHGEEQQPARVQDAGAREDRPDLTDSALRDIAEAGEEREKVDYAIVSNTTIARPETIQSHAHGNEAGGLSGKPLMEPSTKVLHDLYKLNGGKITLMTWRGVSERRGCLREDSRRRDVGTALHRVRAARPTVYSQNQARARGVLGARRVRAFKTPSALYIDDRFK